MKTLHVEINENSQKIKTGHTYKFLPISFTNCPGLLNLISKNAMRQAFYSLFSYADYLINIFRNINGNIVKLRKSHKFKGYTYKITYFFAANWPRASNLVSY